MLTALNHKQFRLVTMKQIHLLISVFILFSITKVQGQQRTSNTDFQNRLNNVDNPYFIENKGQWPREVLYLTQMGGLNAWITTKGIQLEFYKIEAINQKDFKDANHNKFDKNEYKTTGQRVGFNFIGNNISLNSEGQHKQTAYKNYLIGNDHSKHAANVALYGQVIVKEIYAGIDIRYYFEKDFLRYDYIVHPGADASQIRFNIDGSDKTYLNSNGELVFTTLFGEAKNTDLYCYTKKDEKKVAAKFTNHDGNWSIDLDEYDKNQTLIIDPLIYSTYIGGNVYEESYSIAVNTSNNAYVCGFTNSANYDIVMGSFQFINAGNWDVFVSKLNDDGTGLIYSTYIGGSGSDFAVSNAIDSDNNLYITGYTDSPNYDVTSGAFQMIKGLGFDGFITKLNATGTALIYSSYIGGNDGDYSRSIVIDTSNNAYISGSTYSTNFPTSMGAFQNVAGGLVDIFVSKINAYGSALIYSTYIGTFNNEEGQSIAVDTSGNAYITGRAHFGFIITPGAFQSVNGGGSDAFIIKLNTAGSALIYSTYVGGNGSDSGYDIALDSFNNAYITGDTESSNYLVSPDAFQNGHEGGFTDAFVTKINASGTQLIYSTYVGGNGDDTAYSIAVDMNDNAYITGLTESTNFDITNGAFQTTNAAGRDVFVTQINPTGTALIYSTYVGGDNNDVGLSIALDTYANGYITGLTWSTDFDTTTGSFQTINAGARDLFVFKLDFIPELSINENTKHNLFNVFPNPSQGFYQIVFENTFDDSQIEVYDLLGRLIFNQQDKNKNSMILDLSNEQDGVYILKVKTNNIKQVMRLVKL